jgi:hypothetical protein
LVPTLARLLMLARLLLATTLLLLAWLLLTAALLLLARARVVRLVGVLVRHLVLLEGYAPLSQRLNVRRP